MKKILLGKLPAHGLVFITVPRGAPCFGVRAPDGAALESQWIPAPFDNKLFAGRLLVKAPDGAGELLLDEGAPECAARPGCGWAKIAGGRLVLERGCETLTLADMINNRALDHFPALAYDIAFDAQKGAYPLFNGDSVIETVSEGSLATVLRVTTPVKEARTGRDLHGTVAAYDIIRFAGIPMLEISACFKADSYALVHNYSFADLRVPLSEATGWAGGLPLTCGSFAGGDDTYEYNEKFLARSLPKFMQINTPRGLFGFVGAHPLVRVDGGEASLVGDNCNPERNIQEYGPGDGFRANLFYGAPQGGGDLSGWIGNLPRVIRAIEGAGDAGGANGTSCPDNASFAGGTGSIGGAGGVYELRAGDLTVTLHDSGDGLDLTGIRDGRGGESLLSRNGNQLFTLLFRETGDMAKEHFITSLEGWGRVFVAQGAGDATIIFSEPKEPALAGVSAALSAVCDARKNRVSWELDVRNASDRLTLIASEYPALYYDVKGDLNTLCNQDCGRVRADMAEAACHVHYRYPAMSGCMQYQAAWRGDTGRGLYYGVHDPEGVTKHLFSEINNFSFRGNMRILTESVGTGEPMNGQKLPGTTVWQLFYGDWYDATMIYREWALANARWVPQISAEEGRADSPRWMREAPVWFNQSIGSFFGNPAENREKWADELIECREDLGIPVAVHVYNWHQIPFDNDYPHYNPAKLTFMENIDRLHEAGIKVMPYINCRLWDTHDRREKDWKFTKEARPYATTTHFGEPYVEQYVAKEVDGNPVRLAPMCPTTAAWQEKAQEICGWLMNDIGVDAIYLDQIAAGHPMMCMNKNHAHRPGNGSWWQYGYYNLLEHLKRRTPKDRGYTTEANAEVYMRIIDSYLTWGWVEDGQVPSFSAVYGGYVGLFGRCYSPDLRDHLRILAGQSLLFGEQIGWISPSNYLNSPYRALFRKIARTRHKYTRYFAYGSMRRPPVLSGDIPSIVSACHMGEPNMLVCPATMGAMWKRNDTGDIIIVLENLADEPVAVNVRADLQGELTGELQGDLSGSITVDAGRFDIELPAQSVVVVELA